VIFSLSFLVYLPLVVNTQSNRAMDKRCATLETGCTLNAVVPRSNPPSVLRRTVNEHQPYG